jgi:hypothetical protein
MGANITRILGLSSFFLSSGYGGALFPMVKRPEREADHSSPSSAVDNAWNYTSNSSCILMAWYLVKQLDNFVFRLNEEISPSDK